MSFTDEQCKYIIKTYPSSCENNTEFVLRVWETALSQRGKEMPDYVKDIIRSYKPEAITRKRREFIPPTLNQKEEEYKYWKNYKHN